MPFPLAVISLRAIYLNLSYMEFISRGYMNAKVQLENLNVHFGKNHAVKNATMDFRENSVTAPTQSSVASKVAMTSACRGARSCCPS